MTAIRNGPHVPLTTQCKNLRLTDKGVIRVNLILFIYPLENGVIRVNLILFIYPLENGVIRVNLILFIYPLENGVIRGETIWMSINVYQLSINLYQTIIMRKKSLI